MRYPNIFSVLVLGLLLASCGNEEEAWIEEHGYGPVTEKLEPGDINPEKASEGKQIFEQYCTACHAMTSSISGPALGRTADKRSAEWIVNYTLNPSENRREHPVGQELGDSYTGNMTDTGVNKEEAIIIYEYLRYYAEYGEDPS